eukprot:Colp12_sorted_trinity150504_noHs@27753
MNAKCSHVAWLLLAAAVLSSQATAAPVSKRQAPGLAPFYQVLSPPTQNNCTDLHCVLQSEVIVQWHPMVPAPSSYKVQLELLRWSTISERPMQYTHTQEYYVHGTVLRADKYMTTSFAEEGEDVLRVFVGSDGGESVEAQYQGMVKNNTLYCNMTAYNASQLAAFSSFNDSATQIDDHVVQYSWNFTSENVTMEGIEVLVCANDKSCWMVSEQNQTINITTLAVVGLSFELDLKATVFHNGCAVYDAAPINMTIPVTLDTIKSAIVYDTLRVENQVYWDRILAASENVQAVAEFLKVINETWRSICPKPLENFVQEFASQADAFQLWHQIYTSRTTEDVRGALQILASTENNPHCGNFY